MCVHRYVDRPIQRALPVPQVEDALAPEHLPVQHWLDNRRNSNNAADTQPASSSPVLRAAATTFEYISSAAAAVAGVSPTAAVSPGDPAAAESLPETGTPRHADYLAAWRAMSWPPLVRPVDPEFESEAQPQPRRRFQGHGSDNGAENSGGGVGRRRVQARSASRDGRPQSSTDARRAGGGLGGGLRGGGASGGGASGAAADGGSGGWNAEGDDAVAFFLPGHGNGGNGGGGGRNNVPSAVPGGQWHDTHRAHAEALLGGNPANLPGWRGRGFPSVDHQRNEAAVEEHPHVVGGSSSGPPRRETVAVQPHRGRRSLSDFLREIEEMVRAQREVRRRYVALTKQPWLFSSCRCFACWSRENTAELVSKY